MNNSHKIKTNFGCQVCDRVIPPLPPISPGSAMKIIGGVGDNGQFHADGWNYFYDDQEEQINTPTDGPGQLAVNPLLLTAVCLCGQVILEGSLGGVKWVAARDR